MVWNLAELQLLYDWFAVNFILVYEVISQLILRI
jgi:hypothetical protein